MIKFLQVIFSMAAFMLITAILLFVIWLNYLALHSALGFTQNVSMIIVGAMALTMLVGSVAIVHNKD